MSTDDCRRTDGRQVGPLLLPGLGELDQHTAPARGDAAMRAELPDPVEQAVGAFYSFHGDHPSADGYRALPDIERADGASGRRGSLDVSPVLPERPAAGDPALGRQKLRQDVMSPHHLDAAGLDVADQGPQHAIVALPHRANQPRQQGQKRQPGFQCSQSGAPGDAARQDGVGDPVTAQQRHQAPDVLDCQHLVLERGESRTGFAFDHDHERRLAGRCQAFGNVDGQPVAAGDDRDPVAGPERERLDSIRDRHRRLHCRCRAAPARRGAAGRGF